MDRNIGLWIDHKYAYIISHEDARVETIQSHIEPPAHFSGGTRLGGKHNQKTDTELRHNDRFRLQLGKYYQQVIAALKDVNLIFVMGPGEAKIEFEKALKKHKSMSKRLMKIETTDKMTKNQMIARVRKFYRGQSAR